MKKLCIRIGDAFPNKGFIVGNNDRRFIGATYYMEESGDQIFRGFGYFYENYIITGFIMYDQEYCVSVQNRSPKGGGEYYYFPINQF